MKVKTLIKHLQKYDGDLKVMVGTSCIFPLTRRPAKIKCSPNGDNDPPGAPRTIWVVAISIG